MKSQLFFLSAAFAFLVLSPASKLTARVVTTSTREPTALQREWDCRIFGRIVRADGRPMANTRVGIDSRPDAVQLPDFLPMQRETLTDADGRYSFTLLRPGAYSIRIIVGRRSVYRNVITVRGDELGMERTGEKRELNITLHSAGGETPPPSPAPTTFPSPIATQTPLPSPISRPSQIANSNANRAHINFNENANTTTTNANTSTTNANSAPINLNFDPTTTGVSIEEQINALVHGKIVYDIPPLMSVGKTYVIKVGVAKELTSDIAARANNNTNVKVEELPVNDVMDVDLISEEAGAFDIQRQQPKSGQPGWQIIGGQTASEWIFSVAPRQSGTHKLRLVATVQLHDPKNQNLPKSFNVYENDIAVSTDYVHAAGEFFANYWQWLLTFIIVPVGGYGVKVLKNRWSPRRPPSSDTPDVGD